jgi:hypothetical protein
MSYLDNYYREFCRPFYKLVQFQIPSGIKTILTYSIFHILTVSFQILMAGVFEKYVTVLSTRSLERLGSEMLMMVKGVFIIGCA